MSDTTMISIGVAGVVLLGAVIVIKGSVTGFVLYLVTLALIFGLA